MYTELMYSIQDVLAVAAANETTFIAGALITYFFGFAQYFSSIYMQLKNKTCPFYFWMHAWYFGHDVVGASLFYMWFHVVDYWLFKMVWVGMCLFVIIEVYSCVRAVKYERQEIWGKYHPGEEVTLKQGIMHAVAGYAAGLTLFAGIRLVIGDPMLLILMMSTNASLALCLHLKLHETQVALPGTKIIAWFTLFGTMFTFAPAGIGWFATAVAALNVPAFYVIGVLCVICALHSVYLAYTLPKGTVEDTTIPVTRQIAPTK